MSKKKKDLDKRWIRYKDKLWKSYMTSAQKDKNSLKVSGSYGDEKRF